MRQRLRSAIALSVVFLVLQGSNAHAQWGYPWGLGGFGWAGWGAATAEGDLARGLGAFAAAAGVYNRQTAEANAIDADTVIRWNQYLYNSQQNANRQRAERLARNRENKQQASEAIQRRLRDNPEQRDVFQGDALNVALDEINDPRIYLKGLKGTKATIGGEKVRNIPFNYAAAAITVSIHQLAGGKAPASLQTPLFETDREAIRAIDQEIYDQLEKDQDPDPATIKRLLDAIGTAEAKVSKAYERNTKERVEADKYLKALHGLAIMLQTPAIDVVLAGVEKRPETTLGELLQFMRAFNLRFGVASTPQQRQIYLNLYPMLVSLRNEVAPALAKASLPHVTESDAQQFFSGVTYDDLHKKTPRPSASGKPSSK